MTSSLSQTRETDTSPVPDESQRAVPYADALRSLASHDWERLMVPAHQARAEAAPGVASVVGVEALRMDFPMLFSGVDQDTWRLMTPGRPTPLARAQALAAEAWGARRTWFITSGASGGNHIATNVVRALGTEFVVQRSVHSSVIDGIIHVGLRPHFVYGEVDAGLGAAHGVRAEAVAEELHRHPESVAVYVVSPSYFGAIPDIAAIADVAHAHGVPLIVDEAWGSHLGMSPLLPTNAVRLGADLVVSSTHKGAGSLTQSAMLHLGHGTFAERIEELADRVVRSYQSTSTSALLLASLDEARRHLVTHPEAISHSLAAAAQLRSLLRSSNRFRDATPDVLASPDAVAHDPLKVAIDMRSAGISGDRAHHLLLRDHRIYCELATPSALLLMIGATTPVDVDRFWHALTSLPLEHAKRTGAASTPPLTPPRCRRALDPADAFFRATETISWREAAGRISADSLAAYPPGVPNVLPGEVLDDHAISFLRATATSPSGYVRGASDPAVDTFRVVA